MTVALVENLKQRVVAATTGLFSHGRVPLESTLDHRGDPGLLGPDSVSWHVIGDVTAFVGGIRALLIQTAHPEVVAGVEQHSSYRSDPLGRLTRTSLYVTETTYGSMPEVSRAVEGVRHAHAGVSGRSDRGRAYSAAQPALSAWVHNVLTDSFLAAYMAYGPSALSVEEADRFVAEQSRVGALLGADPLPQTAAELSSWVAGHPELESSPSQRAAVEFLRNPPLTRPVKLGYRVLLGAAAATIPQGLGELIGVPPPTGARAAGQAFTTGLRWALGSSPSWHLALVRSGAPVPPGRFVQPLRVPVDASTAA